VSIRICEERECGEFDAVTWAFVWVYSDYAKSHRIVYEDLFQHSFCSKVDAEAIDGTSKGRFQGLEIFEDTISSRSCAFPFSCST
jgi:hypothetical protein